MATVVSNHEKRPEHGTLRRPVSWPQPRVLDGKGSGSKACHDHHVSREVGERTEGILLEALCRDGLPDILQSEGWLCSKVEGRTLRWLRHKDTQRGGGSDARHSGGEAIDVHVHQFSTFL